MVANDKTTEPCSINHEVHLTTAVWCVCFKCIGQVVRNMAHGTNS